MVAIIGLPINDPFSYVLLVAATVLILTGTVTTRARRWLAAAAIAGVVIAGRVLFPTPHIEEGHNTFFVDGAGGALERGLPADAFRQMLDRFDAAYPADIDANATLRIAGKTWLFQTASSAFSADGLVRRTGVFAAGDRVQISPIPHMPVLG